MIYKIPKERTNATAKDHEHFKNMNNRLANYKKSQLECGHELTEIAHKYRDISDKGPTSTYWRKHCYTEFYGPLFQHLKNEPINILEIGVRWGGSLLMWSDYFPNANITGVDITLEGLSKDTKQELQKREINLFKNDGYSSKFFTNFIKDKKYDIILDDGSHTEKDQVKFFNMYKDSLKEGGFLLSEDFATVAQATRVIHAFDGKVNNMSLVIRNHCIPSGKGEIIVMYKE